METDKKYEEFKHELKHELDKIKSDFHEFKEVVSEGMEHLGKFISSFDVRIGTLEASILRLNLSKEGVLLKCNHCGKFWRTRTEYKTVSCPDCGGKVKVSENMVDEDMSGEIADMKRKQKDFKHDKKKSKKKKVDYVKGKDPTTQMKKMGF